MLDVKTARAQLTARPPVTTARAQLTAKTQLTPRALLLKAMARCSGTVGPAAEVWVLGRAAGKRLSFKVHLQELHEAVNTRHLCLAGCL